MADGQTKDRREQILDAALETVGRYGYRRTSMDDIAKAAGISRPTLYQLFANKADIYRGVVQSMIECTLEAAREELAAQTPISRKILAALVAAVIEPHRIVERLPHGAEILSIKDEVAQDLMDDWSNRLAALVGEAFESEPDVNPEMAHDLTMTTMNVIGGIKARGLDADAMLVELNRLARVLEKSLPA